VQAFACLSLAELLQPGSPLKSRKLFTRLIEKYGQVKVPDANLTIADVAAPKLYELEHHARGMTAPDFEGRETNDNPMSLHDFRGKIVMLDFFGTWCGPCCSMFEHERSLVQKYPAEKFAILGVDCDDSREDLEKLEKDKTITWPCFFDGQRPSPIVTQWHVRAFPTTFILDKKGKIFSKIVGANLPAIDAAIEKLMSSHN
jgi:peroxiredoxin